MTMSRPVIPPLVGYSGQSSQQTMQVLESRLQAAEKDTKELVYHLGSMGVDMEDAGKGTNIYESLGSKESPDMEKLRQNYESIISRVCRNESVLQSLKLNFVTIQGELERKRKLQTEVEDKLQLARTSYEQDINKYKRQIEQLQEEVKLESETVRKSKEEISELKQALEEASEARIEASVSAKDLTSGQQKLQKKIDELKEENNREKSLRVSLEESHNTLLSRVREIETLLEEEKSGVKTLTMECTQLKVESDRLREELKEETRNRHVAENTYKLTVEEKEKLQNTYTSAEADRKVLMSELTRLREQYEDLIKQMEQTQAIIDKQQEKFVLDKITLANRLSDLKSSNKDLVGQNEHLSTVLNSTTKELEKYRTEHKKHIESERVLCQEHEALEEEVSQLKSQVAQLSHDNQDLKKKWRKAEEEGNNWKMKLNEKDEQFTLSADNLEKELTSLRHQLSLLQKEKDRTLKDKENLLEEVNQTVDSMIKERSRLHTEIQQSKLEVESHNRARRKLEQENAHLLDRLAGFEQQQETQKRVENTMKEIMEQKNKLAYENGRLQTQVDQMRADMESMSHAHKDAKQNRQLNEGLQTRLNESENEISELKIMISRLESQLKQSHAAFETKEKELVALTACRDEVQKENQKLLTQLQSVEEREKRKVASLQRNLEDAKSVNKEISSTLEAVMTSHSQLQKVIEELQVDLGKKDSNISRLKNEKNQEQDEWKQEMKKFEERMESLREELRKERDKTYKKSSKDISEVKKQNDNLSARNMELVKANTELRHKVADLETSLREQKEKVTEHKRKVEYLTKTKKELEDSLQKMKDMKVDIEGLENMRDTYAKKNKEQAEMISNFMDQISSLQAELRQLAQAQSTTNDLIRQRDQSLDRERKFKEEVKKKYKEARQREEELAEKKRLEEIRLKEAQNESFEVSKQLQDANNWFRAKFDKLQEELVKSRYSVRRTQEKLERENEEQRRALEGERQRANEAAEKAKEMIRTSRETVNRLSDYAELADHETKEQLVQLYEQLQRERDHAKYLEMKHSKYKAASSRQFEKLLNEIPTSVIH
ncbi:hypothetical protein CHS0354_026055 [Potamilus streckersoni]|uniref:Uncharacterized protein n=1 Tax=Potamilus streckersoni TaxID=2493646 RepID=A0AAE0SFZ5_9BIVA|nr:hypothetical protein CHS0354_026055 [Potamilus streckersoni]